LAAAAPRYAPQAPQAWLEEQKTRFKTGQQTDVLTTLRPWLYLRAMRADQQWNSYWRSLQS
jgi:hypothetical protein